MHISIVLYDLWVAEHNLQTQRNARVAQLVERDLAKVEAAGSSPVSRFFHAKDIRKDILFAWNEPCRAQTEFRKFSSRSQRT